MSYVSVRLHPAHFDKSGTPQALRWGQAPASREERFKVLAEEASGGLADCDDECPMHTVLQNSRNIVLRMSMAEDIKVPMLLAEVGYAIAAETSVVSVARLVHPKGSRSKGLAIDVWLFVVADGQAGLLSFLRLLSDGGAVRNDFERYFAVPGQPFGCGAEGCVYKVHPLQADKDDYAFAAKALPAGDDERAAKAEAEAKIFFLAQGHPNIARLRGAFFTADWQGKEEEEKEEEEPEGPRTRQILLMEFYGKGSIGERIEQQGTYSENEALTIMNGLLSALEHIHERGIVHRDVKADNILRGMDGRPILADFGIAAFVDDKLAMEQRCGTPGFCAPEILMTGVSYGKKVDIFSAGVVLYVMLFGCTPFSSDQDEEDPGAVYQRIVDCRVEFPPSRAVTEQVRRLVLILLHKDPENRPSAVGALDVMGLIKQRAPASQTSTFNTIDSSICDFGVGDAFSSAKVGSPRGSSSTPRAFTPVAPPSPPSKASRSSLAARRFCAPPEEQSPTRNPKIKHYIGNIGWNRGSSSGAASEASTRSGYSGRPSDPTGSRTSSIAERPSETSGRRSSSSFIGSPNWFHRGRRIIPGGERPSEGGRVTPSTPVAPAAPVIDKLCPAFLRRRALGAGGD